MLRARRRRRRRDERRARPPRDLRLAGRARGGVPRRSSRGRAGSRRGTRPELLELLGRPARRRSSAPRRRAGRRRRRASRWAAARCAWRCRARTTPPTPPRRSRRCGWRAPTRGRGRGAGGLPRRRAPLRGARHAPRRARPSSTTTPTTRPRWRRRSPPRARSAPRRLVAVFQPHLYSRTRQLAREFGAALAPPTSWCVLDVYPARERAEDFPGVSGLLIAEAAADAAEGGRSAGCPASTTPSRSSRALLRDGDLCLVLGAGDVDALGRSLVTAPPA